jgi:hypothetical protein
MKVSNISTEYVAIRRTAFGRGFYPCKLKVLLMTEIITPKENETQNL